MKKIVVTAIAILMAVATFAQNGESIYRKYSGKPGVTGVYISPAMFRMMGSLPLEEMVDGQDLAPLIKQMNGFYLIEVSDAAMAGEVEADVRRLLSSNKFELLMEVKDEGNTVKMMSLTEGDYVKSFVMTCIEENETVFICLDGDILKSDLDNFIASQVK